MNAHAFRNDCLIMIDFDRQQLEAAGIWALIRERSAPFPT